MSLLGIHFTTLDIIAIGVLIAGATYLCVPRRGGCSLCRDAPDMTYCPTCDGGAEGEKEMTGTRGEELAELG